jgi:hypothetical protein
MNQALKVLGIVVLALVAVGVLLGGGFLIGRAVTARQELIAYPRALVADGAFGPGMMQGWDDEEAPFNRRGMMDGWAREQAPFNRGGMMGGWEPRSCSSGECPFGAIPGGFERMPMFGGGPAAANVEPLTVESTTQAVQTFLDALGKDNLALGEIMVFDNHAYAVIEDTTTGQGAFEVLVDPVRQVVHLEFGPSMMWNTTYGMHGTDPINPRGMMGGRSMMGGLGNVGPVTVPDTASALTEAEAREKAVAYLEQAYPGQTLSATAEAFPGYFTFDVETDGAPVGMLSVNISTGQVWYHTWHGAFVEMSE